MHHDIQFCTTDDGVRIAYAVSGSGPPLVKAATWLSHLEFDRQSPVWRHWIAELSRTHTLIRYDERGCGLSDWDTDEFSIDTWVRDLETVVDAVGCDRFSLLGISQGAPVAIQYAIRHPERVDRMVLHGSFARGWRNQGDEESRDEGEYLMGLTARGWGRENPAYRQLFTGLFLPGADEEQLRSFNELQRVSTSPENAVRFFDAFGDIQVEDSLDRVRVPTLVLHSRKDAVAPFEEGRRVAAGIPGSRFVTLESENHVLVAGEPAWTTFLEEVRRFLDVSVDDPDPAAEGMGDAERPETSGESVAPPASTSAGGSETESPFAAREAGEAQDQPSRGFLDRLKRRKVGQWGLAYLAGAWVALEALDLVAEPWNVSTTIQRGVQVGLVAGLPATVVLAWYHGDEGRQRMGVGELVIFGLILGVAVALMVYFGG